MGLISEIYEYWYFVRRFEQLAKLNFIVQGLLNKECDLSEDAQAALLALNRKRRKFHEELGELNKSIQNVCATCGVSCMGTYDHYSATDFWLRKYSSKPVKNYCNETVLPWYIKLIRHRLEWAPFEAPDTPRKGCEHLGSLGCKVHLSERPVKCLLFYCRKLRNVMPHGIKRKYAKLNTEYYKVCRSCFRILKKEAGLPLLYGELELALTI